MSDTIFGHLPVLTLYRNGACITMSEDRRLGANGYIQEPFVPLDLKARVDAHVAQFQRQFHANPLTGLPGSVLTELEIRRRLEAGEQIAVLAVDLNDLEAYNTVFGFDRGDEVILYLRN